MWLRERQSESNRRMEVLQFLASFCEASYSFPNCNPMSG